MTNLSLTSLQRLHLRALIRVQQPMTIEALETLSDILAKVDFAKDEEPWNEDGVVDQKRLAELADISIQLEKAEVKILIEILRPSDRFKPGVLDLIWLRPLLKALAH